MYLLYLDESGTHGGAPAFVLAGIAVHEQDAWHLQRGIERALRRKLPAGLNPNEFELHAAEIKTPIRTRGSVRTISAWARVPVATRFDILSATYHSLASYNVRNSAFPLALFGAVVDAAYKDREERAYEEVLNKFDEMLTRQAHLSGVHERGIVIHDKRVIERDVQMWTGTWRRVAGRIGKLSHLADVPFFADSRASRLIQAADFVTWGLWRYYGLPKPDDRWIRPLWQRFDNSDGIMHGLIHVSPNFASGGCECPPCMSRQGRVMLVRRRRRFRVRKGE